MSAATSVGSAVTGLFGGGATAVAGAGTAASGISALSGTFSTLSAFASLGAGIMSMRQGEENAGAQEFQSQIDDVESQERVAALAEERNKTIANNLVTAAASGIDVSAGEPGDAAYNAERDAGRLIETERQSAAVRRYSRNRMAAAATATGYSGLISGVSSAGRQLTSSAMQTARRGLDRDAA